MFCTGGIRCEKALGYLAEAGIDTFKQLNDDLTGTPPGYGSYRTAYPIGTGEMNANPNMVENYGY